LRARVGCEFSVGSFDFGYDKAKQQQRTAAKRKTITEKLVFSLAVFRAHRDNILGQLLNWVAIN
jgi:hypothetical protein